MLGLKDPWIISAYLACVLSTLICIIYGITYWNRGGENEANQIDEETSWEKGEREVESKL
jgi:hypothetical protein